MKFNVTRPCSGSDVYNVVLDEDINIDLFSLREKLLNSGYDLKLSNKFFLKVNKGEIEITIYSLAKFLVRNVKDEHEAIGVVRSIIEVLNR